jgi:hypothetical protein
MENQSRENDYEKVEPFYAKRSNRVSDIGLGGFMGLIFAILPFIFSSMLFSWIIIALYLLAILFFFLKSRYYISIGMLAIVAIPLLIFGGCTILIGGIRL